LIVYVISKTPFSASESTFVLLKAINKVQKRSFELIGSNSNQDYHRILWGYQPLLQLAVNTALHPENWGKGGIHRVLASYQLPHSECSSAGG
jgi:hypothetical protein